MLNINNLRKEYRLKSLHLSDVNPDPFLQFLHWFREAQEAQVAEPNAMSLATSSLGGRPSCRYVLLKGVDDLGFLFFTNYESRKGKELGSNPFACTAFYWPELERQVIIEGGVQKLTREETEAYFVTRPRGSQLGAWASHQDQVIETKSIIEEAYRHYEKLFQGREIQAPPHWGGYRLIPERFEFWQGREDRMHDRFRYTLEQKIWKIDRLAP